MSKWQAEYNIENDGHGGFQVSYIPAVTAPKKFYLEEVVAFWSYVGKHTRTFKTIERAEKAARLHARYNAMEATKGQVVLALGKLP